LLQIATAGWKPDFAMMNTYFARPPKVFIFVPKQAFIFRRNGCSSSAETGVHLRPKWVFTSRRNTQFAGLLFGADFFSADKSGKFVSVQVLALDHFLL
jgi:hypothetical protein